MKPLTRVVEIEWIDPHSVSDGGWVVPADVDHTPRTCRSVGYVLQDSPETLTFVGSQAISDDDVSQVGDGVVIPRSVVVRVTPLAPALREVS